MLAPWAESYVGIPYCDRGRTREEGVDCWGLVWLAHRDELDHRLPDYVYPSAEEDDEVARLLRDEPSRYEDVTAARWRPGDVLVIWGRDPSWPTHVALYAGRQDGADWMLTTSAPMGTQLQRISDVVRRHLSGVYRVADAPV